MEPSPFTTPIDGNSTFNCVVDGCASTGFCVTDVGLCSCRIGYIGIDCSTFAYAQSDLTWIYFMFHVIFFSAVFFTILVWALTEIGLMVSNDRKDNSICDAIVRLLRIIRSEITSN